MKNCITALFCILAATGAGFAATLSGTVVADVTGVPIVGARVELVGTASQARTDELGRFALEVPERGSFTVVVAMSGFRVARQTFNAPADAARIVLTPIASFSDRVEVTASRAQEGRDPVTVTNLPGERIADAYVGQDPAMLLAEVAPGFYAYNDNGNDIGYSYFSIRGFGQARTRVTLNGAPLNDAESGELFFIDLADFLSTTGDVQIQRGVFGLSGIGGALDVTTALPPVEPSFLVSSGFGSYGTRRLAIRFASGLIDGKWALETRYSKITTNGYRDQSWVDMWNAYISLARFGRHSTTRIVLFGGPEQTHLAYDGVPRSVLDGGLTGNARRDRRFNPLTYPNEIDSFTQPHFQVLNDWEISPRTHLAQTFYVFQGNGYYDQFKADRALVEYDLPPVTLPDGTTIETSDLVRRRTVSEWDGGWVPTLRHTSGAWSWTLRGEARLHRAHHFGEVKWSQYYPLGVAPDHRYYDYRIEKRTAALAGEITWAPSGWLTLQGGLELAHNDYRISHDRLRDVAFTDSYDFALPRLGAVLHLSADADAYVHVARGMREPAFRNIYDPEDYYGERVHLDPEDVWDWETGVSFRHAAWRLRANLFWMRFANEIVYAGTLDDNGVPVYGNGARSIHRGVELETGWSPDDATALDASVTWSRNTFSSYREYGWDGSTTIYDGNRIAGFPDLLVNLTAKRSFGPVTAFAAARYVGRFYLDNSQNNRRDPTARQAPGYVPLVNPRYSLLDLGATVHLPAAVNRPLGLSASSLQVRVNNVFDTLYTAFGYVDGGEPLFTPAAGRNVYVGLDLGL